jgi:hypothetical protein
VQGDETYRRWGEWYDSRRLDVSRIFIRRSVFTSLGSELDRTRLTGLGFFVDTMRPMYADAQVMAVRRLIETPKHRSLMQLIRQMQPNASVLTRERSLAEAAARLGDDLDAEFVNTNFSRLAGGDVDVIPRAVTVAIGTALSNSCANVVSYAHWVVVHLTERDAKFTFGGLVRRSRGLETRTGGSACCLKGRTTSPNLSSLPSGRSLFKSGSSRSPTARFGSGGFAFVEPMDSTP